MPFCWQAKQKGSQTVKRGQFEAVARVCTTSIRPHRRTHFICTLRHLQSSGSCWRYSAARHDTGTAAVRSEHLSGQASKTKIPTTPRKKVLRFCSEIETQTHRNVTQKKTHLTNAWWALILPTKLETRYYPPFVPTSNARISSTANRRW